MRVLILNVGSSTVRFSVFEGKKIVEEGIVNKVLPGKVAMLDALNTILSVLNAKQLVIDAVVHRIVHGGSLDKPVVLDARVISRLRRFSRLAPLHDVPELKMVGLCKKRFACVQVGVFDTSFHASMPVRAWKYALPKRWMARFGIRRFGFHGLSHAYVAKVAPRVAGKRLNLLITCHLGNGVSVTAVRRGRSVDTSMGWTPLEGCVMGTRCGDIDPAIPVLLMGKAGLHPKRMDRLLNAESGLKGLCGDSDMRRVLARKDAAARMAVEVFCYRITKYIGAYAAVLGGVDGIAFAGGVGQHCPVIRKMVLKDLAFLGVCVDGRRNRKNAQVISSSKSKVSVVVIPTDEGRMMMEAAASLLGKV